MATKKQAGHSTRTTKMIGSVPVSAVSSQWRTIRRAKDGTSWESAGGVNQKTKAVTWRPQAPFEGIRESKDKDDLIDVPLDATQRAASLSVNFGEVGGYPYDLGHVPLGACRTIFTKMSIWPTDTNDENVVRLNTLADKQEAAAKTTKGDDGSDAFAGILS